MMTHFLLLFIMFFALPFPSAQAALDTQLPWDGTNREAIDEFIKRSSQTSSKRRIATFDWDNTVVKNDVGDAFFLWMLQHDLYFAPKSWAESSSLLSEAALSALKTTCPETSQPKQYLKTKSPSACGELMWSIYQNGKIPVSQLAPGATNDAWIKNDRADWIEPAYAWAVQMTQGYRPDEIKSIARQVKKHALSQPEGATYPIGSLTADDWVRVYPQMKDLIKNLHQAKFEVWIVSASHQSIVEVFAEEVGVKSNRVIGVRSKLDAAGIITAHFQPCGLASNANQSVITYRKGKRCWINRVIFGIQDPKQQEEKSGVQQFAAGDSDTDFQFMQDATDFRLVINRQKPELMCHAFANQDNKWHVNQMFIRPKSKKQTPYSCKEFGLPDQKESN